METSRLRGQTSQLRPATLPCVSWASLRRMTALQNTPEESQVSAKSPISQMRKLSTIHSFHPNLVYPQEPWCRTSPSHQTPSLMDTLILSGRTARLPKEQGTLTVQLLWSFSRLFLKSSDVHLTWHCNHVMKVKYYKDS